MSDPVTLLANAIATREGFFEPGSVPSVCNNPGDIRFANQVGAVTPSVGQFSGGTPPITTFRSVALGTNALHRQLRAQIANGQTVREIIAQWAPPSENDTNTYLADVLRWTGLPADTPVLDLLPPLVKMSALVARTT